MPTIWPSSWTRASIASLLTGVAPQVHGAEDRRDALARDIALLSEHFQTAGYRTGAIITNPNVGSFFGFARGFDEFIELYARSEAGHVKQRELITSSDKVTEVAKAWIDRQTEPFFLFVFTVDPQGQSWLVPARAVGMPASSLDPGLLPQGTAAGGLQFDQITVAPFDGYVTEDSLKAAVGNTYVVRSRVICALGVPRYAKIEILELNLAPDTLRLSLKLLDNFNCGYRALEPGLPDI